MSVVCREVHCGECDLLKPFRGRCDLIAHFSLSLRCRAPPSGLDSGEPRFIKDGWFSHLVRKTVHPFFLSILKRLLRIMFKSYLFNFIFLHFSGALYCLKH